MLCTAVLETVGNYQSDTADKIPALMPLMFSWRNKGQEAGCVCLNMMLGGNKRSGEKQSRNGALDGPGTSRGRRAGGDGDI